LSTFAGVQLGADVAATEGAGPPPRVSKSADAATAVLVAVNTDT
jgi:hypothetical protein